MLCDDVALEGVTEIIKTGDMRNAALSCRWA